MSAKKKFLLRLEPGIYGALEKWAADELRSVNGQMEFLLREALRRAGRTSRPASSGSAEEIPDAPPDEKDPG